MSRPPVRKYGIAAPIQGARGADPVLPRARVHRREHPDRNCHQHREPQPEEPDLRGGQNAGTDDLPHCLIIQIGPAKITRQEIAEPDEVLRVERPVEPVLGPQLLDELVGDFRERALDQQLDRIAGKESHQQEDDDRGQEQNGDRREQASNRVLNHPAVLAPRRAARALDPRVNVPETLRLRAGCLSPPQGHFTLQVGLAEGVTRRPTRASGGAPCRITLRQSDLPGTGAVGRVAAGSCPPAAPTDPSLRD